MAMTITVDSVDITAYVDVASIVIESAAESMVATCRFRARDHTGTISIAEKDAISIADGATTLFSGEVADIDESQHGLTRDWDVTCQDNNVLLDETVVDAEAYAAGESDADIIDDLFTTYLSTIDSTTHVATLDASMEAVAFAGMTMRECLDDLARRTGGRYYVDADMNLHWFSAESNPAAFGLSTTPNGGTTPQLLSNTGFETAGAGGADLFASWSETTGAGTIADEGSLVHAGSHAVKLTAAGAGDTTTRVTQIAAVTAGARYTLTFWTRGDGTVAGRYQIYDVTNDASIVAITSTGVTGTTYTQVTVGFTAPAGCVSVRLALRVPAAAGSAYFDDISWTAWPSYGFGGFRRSGRASSLANQVYVLGKEIDGWVEDAASVAIYGERQAVSRDQRITTSGGVTNRGDAILDRYDLPRSTYELWTEHDGLTAGMSVYVQNQVWGLVATQLYIRRIRMTCVDKTGDARRYELMLGDRPADFAHARRQEQLALATVETQVNEIGDTVFDTDAPSAPDALDAGNITTGVSIDADGHQIVYVIVTWSEVSDADLHHYDVQLSTASNFATNLRTRIHPAGGARVERFDGILGNTTHYVRVRAVDWVGNASSWDYGAGSPYSFTSSKDSVPPAQVADLSAAASRTLIGLSWTANSEADLAQYEIQRADDSGGSPGAYATIATARLNFYIDQDFTDGEISGEDTFWYRVRAVDTSGNNGDWSTADSATLSRITADHIAANTITANQIAGNTITAAEIAAGAIDTSELAADAVTAEKIDVTTLSAITADMGTLTAGEIRVGAGTVGADFTGFRIYSSYIGGFNDDELQAGIRTSDGVIVAAGGNVVLYENGIQIEVSTAYADDRSYQFTDGTNVISGVRALKHTSSHLNYIKLDAVSIAGYDSRAILQAEAPVDCEAQALLSADNGGTDSAAISVSVGSDNVGVIIMNIVSAAIKMTEDELALISTDVAHGITDIASTNTYLQEKKASDTEGGAILRGLTEGTTGAALVGTGVTDNTTKSTSGNAYVLLVAEKKSGTGKTTAGSDANLVAIRNDTTTRFIFDAEGSAHADVEWTTFDDYDDLALVSDLERAMLAKKDPVKAEFAEFLRYNRADLQRAGVVRFDDENPGHAMLNTTKLSMLLVGALRQIGARLDGLERQLQMSHG